MRNRSSLVLGVVLVVVAGLAYWLALNPTDDLADGGPTSEAFRPASALLWELQAGDIAEIQIVDVANDRTLLLRRVADDRWDIVAPVAAEADSNEVQFALSNIANSLFVTDTLTEAAALEPFGVLAPAYTIRVQTSSNAESLTAAVGKVNPTGSAYYVLREGEERVVLVGKNGLDMLIGLIDDPPLAVTPTPAPTAEDAEPATDSVVEPEPTPAPASSAARDADQRRSRAAADLRATQDGGWTIG